MVGKTGFEPATSWSQTKRSTKLSDFPFSYIYKDIDGAPKRIRTPNPLIRSQVFYPIELWAQMAVPTRLELAISSVTDWHVNHYTMGPFLVAEEGFEPTTFGLWARWATTALLRDLKKMVEKEGFEPPRLLHPVGFQDRSLQPDLGISPFI